MGQMTTEQAVRILDPETSREALAPYAHDCQLRLAVTEEACTVAAKVLRQTEWISVKDRLPPKRKSVLVHYGNGRIAIDWVNSIQCFVFDALYGRVTHWMPLPEPPKED